MHRPEMTESHTDDYELEIALNQSILYRENGTAVRSKRWNATGAINKDSTPKTHIFFVQLYHFHFALQSH